MCGIVGLLRLAGDPITDTTIKSMMTAIAHRGPDGEGSWIEGNVGLGHTRLAIIDLTDAGNQPMLSENGRYALIYNGEIYNYQELRTELEKSNIRFKSKTDSEVLLNALIHWGTKALDRLNGMFAFALWDRQTRTLLIARDRYGIKPLYVSMQNGNFAFGSEQKAIIASGGFSKKLDKEALLEYFTFQNIFTERTLLKDIELFPAGHFGILDLKDKSPTLKKTQYWDYHFREPEISGDEEEYVEELERLFRQAVNRQLVSDVDLGAYLSGGMDSSSIVAIAAKSLPKLNTFTVGFDLDNASGIELNFDERDKAKSMAMLFGTNHHEFLLKAGDMERSLPEIAWHLEEPRVGQSYPNYYAAKLARKHVKVALSGAGGDELFGGYPWRYYQSSNFLNFEQYIDQHYLYWQRLVDNQKLKKMFAPVWLEVQGVWTRDIFRDVFKSHSNTLERPQDYINHSLYFEAKTFLHGLFIVEDKLSMAHGLETRVPFMDNDLVEFAMQCPVGMKIHNLHENYRIDENEMVNKKQKYFRKTNDGKQILRSTMKRLIPMDVVLAEKQGFSGPDASWFKSESNEFLQSKIFDKKANIYEFLDYKTTVDLVNQHLSGRQNLRLLIWSLLNVEYWMASTL